MHASAWPPVWMVHSVTNSSHGIKSQLISIFSRYPSFCKNPSILPLFFCMKTPLHHCDGNFGVDTNPIDTIRDPPLLSHLLMLAKWLLPLLLSCLLWEEVDFVLLRIMGSSIISTTFHSSKPLLFPLLHVEATLVTTLVCAFLFKYPYRSFFYCFWLSFLA